jgi:ABC-type Fe3+-siderophore transport system permease subunit
MNRWLLLLLAVLFLLSLAVGPAWWPWRLGTYVGWAIVWELRLPRATLGLLIGGVLGLSGAVLQGWLRNPLAEPGVIGVSACAGFAAVCAFYSGLAAAFALALPLAGIAGAAIAVALLMGAVRSGTGTVSLLLMGVAINAIAAALISLVLALSPQSLRLSGDLALAGRFDCRPRPALPRNGRAHSWSWGQPLYWAPAAGSMRCRWARTRRAAWAPTRDRWGFA